jgi:hypothetical protein
MGDVVAEAEYAMRIVSRLSELEVRALQSLTETIQAFRNGHDRRSGRRDLVEVIGDRVPRELMDQVMGSLTGLGLLIPNRKDCSGGRRRAWRTPRRGTPDGLVTYL